MCKRYSGVKRTVARVECSSEKRQPSALLLPRSSLYSLLLMAMMMMKVLITIVCPPLLLAHNSASSPRHFYILLPIQSFRWRAGHRNMLLAQDQHTRYFDPGSAWTLGDEYNTSLRIIIYTHRSSATQRSTLDEVYSDANKQWIKPRSSRKAQASFSCSTAFPLLYILPPTTYTPLEREIIARVQPNSIYFDCVLYFLDTSGTMLWT